MKRSLCLLMCLVMLVVVSAGGCKAVDQATGANNANVGQSLRQSNGQLTRKELSLRLRRLAMSYLGDVPEVCEQIAASDLPLDQRLLALRIRANSADSVITIAADPDPQVSLLNMVTVLTLQRFLAEQRGEEFFGEHSEQFAAAMYRMEREVWKLADQVLDDEEAKELRSLILQYRTDNPEEVYVWWVRFSEFSGYKEQFSVASIGRGVVDLFLPVGDAVAGIETTTDIAERASWLAARQAQIIQWRVELTYLQTLAAPETVRLLSDIERVAETIDNLPKDLAKEREAVLATLEDQDGSLNRLLKQTQAIVEDVDQVGKQASQIVKDVDTAIANADQSIQNAKSILPGTESTLAQLEATGHSLSQMIATLDQFTEQFASESEDEDAPPARPFDITEYTQAAVELGSATNELNALVTNLDRVAQPQRLEQTLGLAKGQVSTLIWQGGGVLLGGGLLLILAGKLIPKRSGA